MHVLLVHYVNLLLTATVLAYLNILTFCVSGHVTTLLGYTSLKSMCWPRELEMVCQIVAPHEKANTGHETNLIIVRRTHVPQSPAQSPP